MTVKKYDEAFKIQTIQYMVEQNKSICQPARELGISTNSIHKNGKIYIIQILIKGQISQLLPVHLICTKSKIAKKTSVSKFRRRERYFKKGHVYLHQKPAVIYEFMFEFRFEFNVMKMANFQGFKKRLL